MVSAVTFATPAAFNAFYEAPGNAEKLGGKIPTLLNNLKQWQGKFASKATLEELKALSKAETRILLIIQQAQKAATDEATEQEKVPLKISQKIKALKTAETVFSKLHVTSKSLVEKFRMTFQQAAIKKATAAAKPQLQTLNAVLHYNPSADPVRDSARVGAKVVLHMQQFEKLERETPASFLGTIKSYVGWGKETEYGPNNRGSLARGIYSKTYNNLVDARDVLLFEAASSKKTIGAYEKLARWLIEAEYIQKAASAKKGSKQTPEGVQAQRGVQLMQLREFISKAELFAQENNLLSAGVKKMIGQLYTKLGVKSGDEPFSADKLNNITTKELITLWNGISSTIDKSAFSEQWSHFIDAGSNSTKSLSTLAQEFLTGMEMLPDYEASLSDIPGSPKRQNRQ
ncbi:MAG TPA: hypothetical protein VN457_02655 [Chlamydiales bacterium]|nr:hypothetical protein [Chlamydiales bacterium]